MASPVYDSGEEFEFHLEGGLGSTLGSLTENPFLPSIMSALLVDQDFQARPHSSL